VYFLVKGLSIDLSLSQVVLVMTVTSLISLIPVSFLGLGTRDVGLILVFRCFGHTGEEAIALSVGLLLIRIVTVFIGSIFWFMDPPVLTELKNL